MEKLVEKYPHDPVVQQLADLEAIVTLYGWLYQLDRSMAGKPVYVVLNPNKTAKAITDANGTELAVLRREQAAEPTSRSKTGLITFDDFVTTVAGYRKTVLVAFITNTVPDAHRGQAIRTLNAIANYEKPTPARRDGQAPEDSAPASQKTNHEPKPNTYES